MVKKTSPLLVIGAIIVIIFLAHKAGLFALITPSQEASEKNYFMQVFGNMPFRHSNYIRYGEGCRIGQPQTSDTLRTDAGAGTITTYDIIVGNKVLSNIRITSVQDGAASYQSGIGTRYAYAYIADFTYDGTRYKTSNMGKIVEGYSQIYPSQIEYTYDMCPGSECPKQISLENGQIIVSVLPEQGATLWRGEICGALKITLNPNITIKPLPGVLTFMEAERVVPITIINKFINNVPAKVYIDYSFQTPTGIIADTVTKEINLLLGENTFDITLPTGATGTMFTNVKVRLMFEDKGVKTGGYQYSRGTWSGDPLTWYGLREGTSFLGWDIGRNPCLWGENYQNQDVQCAGNRPVNIITEAIESFTVMINPAPIWLNVTDCTNPLIGCPEQYTCQEASGLCIRTDIINNQLTCEILACPYIPGHEYTCTSMGVCAETVFIYLDCTMVNCPILENITGECGIDGLCRYMQINEVTKEVKIFANCTSLKCPSLQGITGECLDSGVCKYVNVTIISEEVLKETIKEIMVEKHITCVDDPTMCPAGTSCEPNSQVCIEKHIVEELIQCDTASDCFLPCRGKTIACIDNQCIYGGECEITEFGCATGEVQCPEGYVCDMERNVCTSTKIITRVQYKIPNWMWILIIFGIVFVAYYFLLEKGPRRGFFK